MNAIVNNIIANPETYVTYANGRTTQDSFVYLASGDVNARMSNNMFATEF